MNPSKLIKFFVFAVGLTVWADIGKGQLITFDGLSSGVAIENGYGGMHWTNFYALNASTFNYHNSGYGNGAVSSTFVGYNGYGHNAAFKSAAPFTLTSLYLTAAWDNDLQVQISGFNSGIAVFEHTCTVSPIAPTLELLNFADVDEVLFCASGGVQNRSFQSFGTQFAVDNVQIVRGSPVPEPANFGLMVAAILPALMGLRRWRA